ncbi:hypothetical protein AMJ74_06345 [candidate division WOR_3 bacterium SM1_77]|uniref:Uncharacterized protein n=1 Tax=candidate division WOR_3 bacterium SM1_77 TaxID=1703778 RepID=A0A0S8JVC5_UNCW3|nr:MAG: hypothetical protein AMJ74_06345 [candidate division WOR_3 bacterium SM1_77]
MSASISASISPSPVPLDYLNIIGSSDYATPIYINDSSDSLLIEGALEVQGQFYIRRVSQSAEPTSGEDSDKIDVGEIMIWRDSDDGKIYLIYNDTDSDIKKIELT